MVLCKSSDKFTGDMRDAQFPVRTLHSSLVHTGFSWGMLDRTSLKAHKPHLDAYLELNHLPHILKFGEHILIELQELLVGLLVTVLETGICVIVVSPALLHAKSDEHPSHEQCLARCGVVMLARTPGQV